MTPLRPELNPLLQTGVTEAIEYFMMVKQATKGTMNLHFQHEKMMHLWHFLLTPKHSFPNHHRTV